MLYLTSFMFNLIRPRVRPQTPPNHVTQNGARCSVVSFRRFAAKISVLSTWTQNQVCRTDQELSNGMYLIEISSKLPQLTVIQMFLPLPTFHHSLAFGSLFVIGGETNIPAHDWPECKSKGIFPSHPLFMSDDEMIYISVSLRSCWCTTGHSIRQQLDRHVLFLEFCFLF